MQQAWEKDGSFGRQEAILPSCIFLFSQGMGRTPQAEHIQEVRFEDFMFANDLQVYTQTPLPALDKETCWNPDKRGCSATLTRCSLEQTGCVLRWKKEGERGAYALSLSVRRHDKETLELVYMQQWENKLKIPAGTQMHIKTGLF